MPKEVKNFLLNFLKERTFTALTFLKNFSF